MQLTDDEWRSKLTPEEFAVPVPGRHGTPGCRRAHRHAYRRCVYNCRACRSRIVPRSTEKFDSHPRMAVVLQTRASPKRSRSARRHARHAAGRGAVRQLPQPSGPRVLRRGAIRPRRISGTASIDLPSWHPTPRRATAARAIRSSTLRRGLVKNGVSGVPAGAGVAQLPHEFDDAAQIGPPKARSTVITGAKAARCWPDIGVSRRPCRARRAVYAFIVGQQVPIHRGTARTGAYTHVVTGGFAGDERRDVNFVELGGTVQRAALHTPARTPGPAGRGGNRVGAAPGPRCARRASRS